MLKIKIRGSLQYKLVVRHCLKCNGIAQMSGKNEIKILLYFKQTVISLQRVETVLSVVFKLVKTYLQISFFFYISFLITYMSAPVQKVNRKKTVTIMTKNSKYKRSRKKFYI